MLNLIILWFLTLNNYLLLWVLYLLPNICYLIYQTVKPQPHLVIDINLPNQKKPPFKKILKWLNFFFVLLSLIGVGSGVFRGSVGLSSPNQAKIHHTKQINQLTQSQNVQSYLNQKTKESLPKFEHQWYVKLAQQQQDIVKDNQNLN